MNMTRDQELRNTSNIIRSRCVELYAQLSELTWRAAETQDTIAKAQHRFYRNLRQIRETPKHVDVDLTTAALFY